MSSEIPATVAARQQSASPIIEARQKIEAAELAIREARAALRKAAELVPGARHGMNVIADFAEDAAISFRKNVVQVFDQALAEEVLRRPVSKVRR